MQSLTIDQRCTPHSQRTLHTCCGDVRGCHPSVFVVGGRRQPASATDDRAPLPLRLHACDTALIDTNIKMSEKSQDSSQTHKSSK